MCVICSWPYPGGIALWADGWQSTDTVHLSRILADKGGKDSRLKKQISGIQRPIQPFCLEVTIASDFSRRVNLHSEGNMQFYRYKT